jgi:hypothetical protein
MGTVIDAGTSGGTTTSGVVARLDRMGLFLAYPRAGQQFIEVVDESPGGPIVVYDGSNNPYDAMVTKFIIRFGVCIGDNRNVVSIRNIQTTAAASSLTPSLLVDAFDTMYPNTDNVVIFMNRTAKKQLDRQVVTNTNFIYTQDTLWGRRVDAFQGVPIYITEAITDTESGTT